MCPESGPKFSDTTCRHGQRAPAQGPRGQPPVPRRERTAGVRSAGRRRSPAETPEPGHRPAGLQVSRVVTVFRALRKSRLLAGGTGSWHLPRGVVGVRAGQRVARGSARALSERHSVAEVPLVLHLMMILLLLFLQKQSLAFAVYLFGIGTLHSTLED